MEKTFLVIIDYTLLKLAPYNYTRKLVLENNLKVTTWVNTRGDRFIRCINKPRNSYIYGIGFVEVDK